MITTLLLNIFFVFIGFFLALLPVGGAIPAAWTSGIQTVWSDVNAFSFIVPVGTLVTCLGIALTFHLFQFGWNFFHWIYGLLRGSRMH